jgi:hypothetical protein
MTLLVVQSAFGLLIAATGSDVDVVAAKRATKGVTVKLMSSMSCSTHGGVAEGLTARVK